MENVPIGSGSRIANLVVLTGRGSIPPFSAQVNGSYAPQGVHLVSKTGTSPAMGAGVQLL